MEELFKTLPRINAVSDPEIYRRITKYFLAYIGGVFYLAFRENTPTPNNNKSINFLTLCRRGLTQSKSVFIHFLLKLL